MRKMIIEAIQILGASAAIAGAIALLLEVSNMFSQVVLSLVIAAATGIIASTVIKHSVIGR